MPEVGRQYESRLDRKLDVNGDLTRAEAQIKHYEEFYGTPEECLARAQLKYRDRLGEV
jgi:hypothetical protein